MYKRKYMKNIEYNPKSHFSQTGYHPIPSASYIEYGPVQLVQIFFDTATFDKIERDVKVTLEAQLGLIGGTGAPHWLLHPQWS